MGQICSSHQRYSSSFMALSHSDDIYALQTQSTLLNSRPTDISRWSKWDTAPVERNSLRWRSVGLLDVILHAAANIYHHLLLLLWYWYKLCDSPADATTHSLDFPISYFRSRLDFALKPNLQIKESVEVKHTFCSVKYKISPEMWCSRSLKQNWVWQTKQNSFTPAHIDARKQDATISKCSCGVPVWHCCSLTCIVPWQIITANTRGDCVVCFNKPRLLSHTHAHTHTHAGIPIFKRCLLCSRKIKWSELQMGDTGGSICTNDR